MCYLAKFCDEIESVLGVQNLGVDYAMFETGDDLADYLHGRRFRGIDEPVKVSEEQRKALREIYREWEDTLYYERFNDPEFEA